MAFAVTVGPNDGTSAAPGSVASVALTGCTAGRSIVIGVRWYDATATISGITITGEADAEVHGSPTKNTSASNATHQIASLDNITSSGDKTIQVTMSESCDTLTVWAMEVSGGNTSDFFEAADGATGNSANGSVSVSTSAGGSLVVGSWTGTNQDATPGGAYTAIALANTSWWDEAEYDLDAGSAGSKTVDFTHLSGQWVVAAAAFNAAGGTAALTGTATSTIAETDIVAGGKTIIATLTSDSYVPAVSTQLITHVTSVVQSSVAFTTSFTIALPSTAANDILLLEYCHRSTNAGGIFGTGGSGTSWTLKTSTRFGPSSTFSMRLFYRRAGGNISNQAIAVSSLIDSCAAMVTVYRGAIDSGDPLASAAPVTEWNTSGDESTAGISTDILGTMVVLTVANSPDLALSNQSSIRIGPLTERAEILNTGGTDASIGHASAVWNSTGNTSTFSWAQTNASSGSMAYAITPLTTSPFNSARQAFIDGFDSAQAEATGWDAEVKAKAAVTEVVRTSDTVVTWTIGAQAAYNITAQETITGTIPGSILISGAPIVATPTFTIDPAGGGAAVIRIFYPAQMEGTGVGGVLGGNRMN